MLKNNKYNWRNRRGFTLVEVMIGMMILTVAIVSASNLLTGIIDSNRNNLTTLQAYYLSQEGLEMVRNIRDTNWLHNKDWLGDKSTDLWGGKFEVGKAYEVEMVDAGGTKSSHVVKDDSKTPIKLTDVGGYRPWKIKEATDGTADDLYIHGKGVEGNVPLIDSDSSNASSDANFNFKRKVIISKYDCEGLVKSNIPCPTNGEKAAYVLVQSKVTWTIGSKPRELTLSEVLSNWKGGAL